MLRRTAFKVWIENLNKAKQIFDAGRFIGVEFNGQIVSRVNVIANVIDKFQGENFTIITVDDSTGIIEVRDFENALKNIEIGDVVLVIGTLKSYNEKIYLAREIVKKVHPLWLAARKLELEKLYGLKTKEETKETKANDGEKINQERINQENEELKEAILKIVKNKEEIGEEVIVEDIYLELNYPIEEIKKAIEQLIDEAKIYEPRPGIIKTF
ncbi:MAG: OB-fold nucleic acid binding domain-containing protein [Candidatus Pacearchaeota archaeon]